MTLATTMKTTLCVRHMPGCSCSSTCEHCGASRKQYHHECEVCHKLVGPCAFVATLHACRWCVREQLGEGTYKQGIRDAWDTAAQLVEDIFQSGSAGDNMLEAFAEARGLGLDEVVADYLARRGGETSEGST